VLWIKTGDFSPWKWFMGLGLHFPSNSQALIPSTSDNGGLDGDIRHRGLFPISR
jgi:hypothetical protein